VRSSFSSATIWCYKSPQSPPWRRFNGAADGESTFFNSWKAAQQTFSLHLPVESDLAEANGKIFREAGQATEVNAQGGLLEMKTYLPLALRLSLTNLVTHETSQARVVGVRRNSEAAC